MDSLPCIGLVSAQQIIAKNGIDMTRFPSVQHLCSWSGVCPGNIESAGKSKSGRRNKANQTLRSTLVECAHAATRVKSSFFSAQYQRLAVCLGKNNATVAVTHSMLIAIYLIQMDKPSMILDHPTTCNSTGREKLICKKNRLKILAGSLTPSALLAEYIPLPRGSAFPAMLCCAYFPVYVGFHNNCAHPHSFICFIFICNV